MTERPHPGRSRLPWWWPDETDAARAERAGSEEARLAFERWTPYRGEENDDESAEVDFERGPW